MAFDDNGKVWMNGALVPWSDAKIHVCSHVVHYGTAVFEGERCYKNGKGSAVFRMHEHTERLFNSAKIYRMEIPYAQEQIDEAIRETIHANGYEECYVRPIVYRGYHSLGVDPFPCPVDVAIAVWPWGAYLGQEAIESGVDVMVSTWDRLAPNTMPALAKTAANYMNSQLIKMEALQNGYAEGIALDANGYVSEGSGENLFVLWKGKLLTPPLGASVLPGITRDTVLTLAADMGLPCEEKLIPREMLYLADEVFFTGSAAEITPIRSVDKIEVGPGRRGPVTRSLQEEFFAILSAEKDDRHGWMNYL
jgi:branched-chain amino acid aminotransferase